MIDRLMARKQLTRGQTLYLETLVQLVQAYEAENHRIETSDLRGIDLAPFAGRERNERFGFARLLDVHASMGSKSQWRAH